MNPILLNTEIQNFICKNLYADPTKLILKGSPFQAVKIQEIVEQIISKKKCENKLPSWFNSKSIYYPNKINIEQSSSEISSKYKAGLISGDSLLDITGGFGVDDLAFAEKFREITHCEINQQLSEIVQYNFKELKVENIKTVPLDGLHYILQNKQKYDWIYTDPSRRNDRKEKVFLLKDCLPNIPENIDMLFSYTDQILLKASPILDITASIKELKFVSEVHIIAINNEVKELLFILQKDYKGSIDIKTINIKKEENEVFNSKIEFHPKPSFSLTKNYLYEPNSAILKGGLFNAISHDLKLDKLHNNSHLYTSDTLIDFPGRAFKILHVLPYDKKQLKKLIPSLKANITTRNFPQTVAEIRKKTSFKEGGNWYLFFTTDLNNKHIVLLCKKV